MRKLAGWVLLLFPSLLFAVDLYVPAVAQIKGKGGRYWNTEMWVTNPSGRPLSFSLVFLPQGKDNTELLLAEGRMVEVEPGQTLHLRDIVPPNSVGALKVTSLGDLVFTCRVFSSGSSGSTGQLVPVVGESDLLTPGGVAVICPFERSATIRTNLGFFNPNPEPATVTVRVEDSRGRRVTVVTYTVQPGSNAQVNDAALAYDLSRASSYRLMIKSDLPIYPYASLVDNRTGDATFVKPSIFSSPR